jgi:hypothetical protein
VPGGEDPQAKRGPGQRVTRSGRTAITTCRLDTGIDIVSQMTHPRAVAVLPVKDAKVAAAALRGRLQLTADHSGEVPDWSTFHVEGPHAFRDARGTEWFEWVATVQAHQPGAEVDTDDPPTGRPTVDDLGILRKRRAG